METEPVPAPIKVRCGACGALLGNVLLTKEGPSWRPRPPKGNANPETADRFGELFPDGLLGGPLVDFDSEQISPSAFCATHDGFYVSTARLREALTERQSEVRISPGTVRDPDD